MRQRLHLAKTLLHDPEVLILDEPASDLDPRARIEMRDLFLRLREASKTIFLSSHILTELSDVCTSIGVIEKGRLVAHGPIPQITQELQRGAATDVVAPAHAPRAKRLKVRVLGAAEAAPRALEGLPGVAMLRTSGDLLVVGVSGGDDLVAALVKRLVESGIGVVGIEPERDELETVFLELTNKEKK
jgi:ABC-2 type transport system ATP-binding protein